MKTATEYLESGNNRKALPLLQKAAKADPNYANIVNLAAAQRALGMIHEAKDQLLAAVALEPLGPEGWSNLGQCFTDLGQFGDAAALFQRSLECHEKRGLHPSAVKETLLGFSHALMRQGGFEFVWPCWEMARIGVSWQPFPNIPVWQGEQCRSLLILPEGGMGDGFNFLRWIRDVADRCPDITVVIWPPLYEFTKYLCAKMPFPVRVLPMSHEFQGSDLHKYSFQTALMSLPACCGMKKWEDIPPTLYWTPRDHIISEPMDMIGFCWRAEENGVARKTRTLDVSAANVIGGRLFMAGSRVVALCPKSKHLHREAEEFIIPKRVEYVDHLLTDWETTARTILKCRKVVTVDTAVAHLAGSLGTPTLLLLPMRSDWKWGMDGSARSWYGSNVLTYRNDHPLYWNVDGILQALSRL